MSFHNRIEELGAGIPPIMPDCSATFGADRGTAPVQLTEPAEPVRVNLFRLSQNQLAWLREQGTPTRQATLTEPDVTLTGLVEQETQFTFAQHAAALLKRYEDARAVTPREPNGEEPSKKS